MFDYVVFKLVLFPLLTVLGLYDETTAYLMRIIIQAGVR
ncbi:hypothetical protein FM107_15515 [Sphingobacterium sp. JB170]|nr:hypothetical protein FM107_15515 [Sphingobacterium sp. JB170]